MQFAAVPDQCKGITTYAIGRGLQHAQGRCSGNGGVNGIASCLQDLKTSLCSQRLRCGHHAALGIHHIATGGIRKMLGIKRQHA